MLVFGHEIRREVLKVTRYVVLEVHYFTFFFFCLISLQIYENARGQDPKMQFGL